jgi:hypothetical protein
MQTGKNHAGHITFTNFLKIILLSSPPGVSCTLLVAAALLGCSATFVVSQGILGLLGRE